MQDKIPDALIAAFERHYSLDWNDPTMRNERLAWRAAWAEATKPCLLQIQEPAAAEQAAWHAGLDEGRAQAVAPVVLPVPDASYKLVPVDLTSDMKREFMDLLMDGIDIYVNRRDQIEIQTDAPRRIWKAVLALSLQQHQRTPQRECRHPQTFAPRSWARHSVYLAQALAT